MNNTAFVSSPRSRRLRPRRSKILLRRTPFWFAFGRPHRYNTVDSAHRPRGVPEAQGLRPVGAHRIRDVWEDNLAPKLHNLLDSMICGESAAPVVLWIGVVPSSLSGKDGVIVASKCREVIVENDIDDVEVEIRDSIICKNFLQLHSVSHLRPVHAVAEGTGGFFVSEGERLLLLTARHVLFPEDKENKSRPLPATRSPSVSKKISFACRRKPAEHNSGEIGSHEVALDDAKQVLDDLNKLLHDVTTHWASPENRVIGHVRWTSRSSKKLLGNAIDLGTRISPGEFTAMMHPNIHDPPSFIYPADRLLEVTGTIPDEEMLRPAANEACIMVIKSGNATGLTIGRANDICSRPFSDVGDSGSAVVDGQGRIGGLLTGGAGAAASLDITYATPVTFLLRRLKENGFSPNLYPQIGVQELVDGAHSGCAGATIKFRYSDHVSDTVFRIEGTRARAGLVTLAQEIALVFKPQSVVPPKKHAVRELLPADGAYNPELREIFFLVWTHRLVIYSRC
ncbi:hypothetical protein B0H13DRAFT_2293953 [Mycena leptocephala]|nr:hypothetical protein B0H13DRAFT_2293953 [Mycena leptocephala]